MLPLPLLSPSLCSYLGDDSVQVNWYVGEKIQVESVAMETAGFCLIRKGGKRARWKGRQTSSAFPWLRRASVSEEDVEEEEGKGLRAEDAEDGGGDGLSERGDRDLRSPRHGKDRVHRHAGNGGRVRPLSLRRRSGGGGARRAFLRHPRLPRPHREGAGVPLYAGGGDAEQEACVQDALRALQDRHHERSA
eukprot:746398-Hanusia_phi.AAC.1